MEKYNNLILVILTGTIYIGPFNQFCESFLEELAETLPHISSYDFMVGLELGLELDDGCFIISFTCSR